MKRLSLIQSIASLFVLALSLGTASVAYAQSPARPDLTIPGIGARNYTTTAIISGHTVKMYWSKAVIFVYNRGAVASAPCQLRLQVRDWVTNAVLRSYVVTVPSVAPGVYQEVNVLAPQMTTDFTDQRTFMQGFVDSNFAVLESNENNNLCNSGPGGFGS